MYCFPIAVNNKYGTLLTIIKAAIANNQLKQIHTFKRNRTYNRNKIISYYNKNFKNKNFLIFVNNSNHVDCNWFGLPILINKKYKYKKRKIIKEIERLGIETRPIIRGNFLNQPAIKLFKLNKNNYKLKKSQEVDDCGFFIGINTKKSSEKILKFVATNIGKAFLKVCK